MGVVGVVGREDKGRSAGEGKESRGGREEGEQPPPPPQKARTVRLTEMKEEQKRSYGVGHTSRGCCIWQNEACSNRAASV